MYNYVTFPLHSSSIFFNDCSSSLLDIMDNVRSVKAGGSRRPTSQSPAEGLDLPFQARSSVQKENVLELWREPCELFSFVMLISNFRIFYPP